MYGALVKFVVKPGMRSEFLEFLRWDAKVAKDTEPGTLRFDVWTSPEPDVVYVYETYTGRPSLSRRALHPTSMSDLAEPAQCHGTWFSAPDVTELLR
jgi:quinol monooxygenase YgiN